MESTNTVPATLQAGDSLTWRRSIPAYPASDGWVLRYRLVNAATTIDIIATADGDDHLVTIPAATSASYTAGDYTAVEYATRGAERATLGQTALTIKPDIPAMGAGFDARTPAQRALADLRTALNRWISSQGHVSEYEIAGRRMRFANVGEIRSRIALAEQEVAREQASQPGAKPPARRLLVRY